MINYKRIKIFRLLYGATIVTALVMGIAIARESYVWPLIPSVDKDTQGFRSQIARHSCVVLI